MNAKLKSVHVRCVCACMRACVFEVVCKSACTYMCVPMCAKCKAYKHVYVCSYDMFLCVCMCVYARVCVKGLCSYVRA